MKRAVAGVIGAVGGYLLVALTLGWFITNDGLLALAYLAGVIGGAVVGVKQVSRRQIDLEGASEG